MKENIEKYDLYRDWFITTDTSRRLNTTEKQYDNHIVDHYQGEMENYAITQVVKAFGENYSLLLKELDAVSGKEKPLNLTERETEFDNVNTASGIISDKLNKYFSQQSEGIEKTTILKILEKKQNFTQMDDESREKFYQQTYTFLLGSPWYNVTMRNDMQDYAKYEAWFISEQSNPEGQNHNATKEIYHKYINENATKEEKMSGYMQDVIEKAIKNNYSDLERDILDFKGNTEYDPTKNLNEARR
jgi:hypothetical protein